MNSRQEAFLSLYILSGLAQFYHHFDVETVKKEELSIINYINELENKLNKRDEEKNA